MATNPSRNTLRLPNRPQPEAETDKGRTPHPQSVVYLVQEPSVPKATGRVIDTTPLLWWGQVRVLMERRQNASFRPALANIQMRERLKAFNPERDYIAVAGGDYLGILLVGAILAQYGHDYFYFLRFERSTLPGGERDPSNGAYVPVKVPLAPAEAMEEVHGGSPPE